jgi:hypothetical protein
MRIILIIFITLFLLGCETETSNQSKVNNSEKELRLAAEQKQKNLLLLKDYRKSFIKEQCNPFYIYELNKFYNDQRYTSLDASDFFMSYLSKNKSYFNKLLKNYAPLSRYYTQRVHLKNYINRSGIFEDIELIHQEILDNCLNKNIDNNKIKYKRRGSIVGDHVYIYLDEIIDSSYHISQLKTVDGVSIKEFRFGDIRLKSYTLWVKFLDGEGKTFDFISSKKAEQFSIQITNLYDEYMRREQQIKREVVK